MNLAIIIFAIGLLIFSAHLFTALFEHVRIPDVLLLMAIGVLLGPVFHVATVADFGKVGPVLSMIALIAILFEGGIDLRLPLIRSAFWEVLTVSLSMYAFTMLLTTGILVFFLHKNLAVALAAGSIAGNISPAVVLPMLRSLRMRGKAHTILFLETALSDVLCIVITLGIFDSISLGRIHAGKLGVRIVVSFFFAALFGVVGALAWSEILGHIRRFPNTIFTTFAYLFVLYGTAEMLHISGAITVLAFGAAIANLGYFPLRLRFGLGPTAFKGFLKMEKAFFSEAVFFLKVFFFIYLGLAVHFTQFGVLIWGGFITVFLYAGRVGILRLLMPRTTHRRDMALMSALAPKGLAAAVLAFMAVEMGIPGAGFIQDLTFSLIVFSIAVSTFLVFGIERTPIKRLSALLFAPFLKDETSASATSQEKSSSPMESA